MEIPGGRGEQPEPPWNGKSGGVGAQTVNNPPWGGVWIFSGTTQYDTMFCFMWKNALIMRMLAKYAVPYRLILTDALSRK